MAKIVVLGAGIMATALSFPASENGHEVRLVGTHLDDDIIKSIKRDGAHPVLELKVNEGVKAYYLAEAAEAFKDADVVMCGVNSFGIEWAGQQFAKLVKPGQNILCITKGMRADNDGTMHILPEILKREMGAELARQVTWSAIVGPSIAGEVAMHHDTCVVFCGENQEALDYLAKIFRTDYYHIWTSTDFLGHETGAATKNIYAFAAGFGDGLLEREYKVAPKYVRFNYGAAIFAQGQKELRQFIKLMNGNLDTADGLGGTGDMFVTSMGGRNVRAGRYVGAGIPFSDVRDNLMKGITLEGVAAIKVIGAALEPLTERGVIGEKDFPLCRYLYQIIAHDAPLEMPWEKFFGGEK